MKNTRRIISVMLTLALSFVLVFALVSCNEPAPEVNDGVGDPEIFTVTFDSAGGTSVALQTVESGKKATEPTAPERAGYEFLGWYLGDEKWSFVGYVVTDNMTLTAKWETAVTPTPTKHTVTFDSAGGTSVASTEVETGKKATEPTAPERAGYKFLGWYLGEEKWSFIGYVVTENITLTAKWEPVTYTLTVNTLEGSESVEFTVESATFKVSPPLNIATKKFIGWRVGEGEALVSEFTVEKGTLGSIEITAVYKDVCRYHVDDNGDGICDACEEALDSDGCEHDDVNGDNYCDVCGTLVTGPEYQRPLWESSEIVMMINKCSNNGVLSSELARYVAGEYSQRESIDTSVAKRNIEATYATNVTVKYRYWEDDLTAKYGYGKTIEYIDEFVNSTTIKDAPDVYGNYIYDLVCASVKGYFANLKGTTRGSGKLKGLNYFEFVYDKENYRIDHASGNDRGFMYDFMESTSLDPENRMYILASDYYIDFVRAMMMMTFNPYVMNEVLDENLGVLEELDGRDGVDYGDFYEMVFAGGWTYEALMEYSAMAYKADDDLITTETWLGDTRIGLALSDDRITDVGIIYTSDIELIKREWNSDKNEFSYSYTQVTDRLCWLTHTVSQLISTEGVAFVKDEFLTSGSWNDISQFSTKSSRDAIRTVFASGNVLFGDIITAGELEEKAYRKLFNYGHLGILPIPTLDESDRYMTQIHSIGKAGAIAYNTKKFVECTAFLNYQSTHSSKIIGEYFTYKLCYGYAGGGFYTVEMLEFLRQSVRSSFDMIMEDALASFCEDIAHLHVLDLVNGENDYNPLYVENNYDGYISRKQEYLNYLNDYFHEAKN